MIADPIPSNSLYADLAACFSLDGSPEGWKCDRKRVDEVLGRAEEWQPIESAPKDGTALLWFPDFPTNEVQLGSWHAYSEPAWGLEGEWRDKDTGEFFENGDGYVCPTHWRPLPPPPGQATPPGGPTREVIGKVIFDLMDHGGGSTSEMIDAWGEAEMAADQIISLFGGGK